MAGKGAGHRPESCATVILLLEMLVKDRAAWQAAFPSHKCYSSTSVQRGEQSAPHTFQLGLLGPRALSVLQFQCFQATAGKRWEHAQTAGFNPPGVSQGQDPMEEIGFPILGSLFLTGTAHRRAQEGRSPPQQHPQTHH